MTDREFKQSLDRWLTREDEWTESAENEPEADEADREWAQALTDETEDEQC